MKKIYRKLKEWLSPQKYWYVAYMFSNSENKGCAYQYVTSDGDLDIEIVRQDLIEMKSLRDVISLNYKRIKKSQCRDRESL